MELRIRNLIAIEELEHEIQVGATLITGKNSAGKTSVAKVIGALASLDGNPYHLSAASSPALVQRGSTEGYAALDQVEWHVPGGINIPPGGGPWMRAPEHAVGLVRFTAAQKNKKDRAALWEELFLPDDPRSILEPVWELPEKQLDVVIKEIESKGWEAAVKIYSDLRLEAKQKWQRITGKPRHGNKLATSWTPEHWTPELMHANRQELETKVVDLRDLRRSLEVQNAVTQHEIDEAARIRDEELPQVIQRGKEAKADLDAKEETAKAVGLRHGKASKAESAVHEKMLETGRKIRAIEEAQVTPLVCPHCEGELVMNANGDLQKHTQERVDTSILKREYAKHEKAYAAKNAETRKIREELDEADEKHKEAIRAHSAVVSEYKTLKAASEKADLEANEQDQERVEKVDEEIDSAKKDLDSYDAYHSALQHHESVVEYDAVCELLGPNGARSGIMQESMKKVNSIFDVIRERTGWEQVRVSRDYVLTSDGIEMPLTSDNEALKAMWSCQIACGLLSKAEIIVLDKADLLKDESWQGLVDMVNGICAKQPAMRIVVCATSAELPDPNWDYLHIEKNA